VAANGALLSELPLGAPPHKSHFPVRNRLIAALTQATLVVEAAVRSGSLITARCALDPSTVSRAVAGLVRSGLVSRSADPADGRASVLAMTPRGRQALDTVDHWVDERLAEALRDWSPEDVATFSALLQRFTTDLSPRTERNLEVAR